MEEPEKCRLLLKGVNVNTKVSEIKKFFRPLRIKDAKILKRGVAVAYFKNKNDLKSALNKEGKLHGSTVIIEAYENELFTDDIIHSNNTEKIWTSVPKDDLENEIKENGRLFVRNLSYDCSEDDLIKLFSPFGTISDVHLSYDIKLHKSKGFAFVSFLFPSDAVKAMQKLDKEKFQGRLLHILPGKERPVDEKFKKKIVSIEDPVNTHLPQNDDATLISDYQRKKMSDLKASASVSHNWNTLFVNPDSVATYLSAKFGVTKEQLLDPSGKESASVRLALGETQLIHELRDFLIRKGVRLDLLEESSKDGRRDRRQEEASTTLRQLSGTAFIIKNLPVGTKLTEVEELIQRLTKSGKSQLQSPKRIILPPLGITAIVEYDVPQIAKMAYRNLSYEPFKDNVLFVQWAPEGILSPNEKKDDSIPAKNKRKRVKNDISDLLSTADAAEVERAAESQIEDPESMHVKKAKTTDYNEKMDECQTHQTEIGNGFNDDNDDGGGGGKTADIDSEMNRTILVRNVAFQANEYELTNLFAPISGLLKVRMPKKVSGGHRGFAFIEFNTSKQAQVALNTFGTDTHLYGRRLNIEFAKQ